MKDIEQSTQYKLIRKAIHSENSPVGIDAVKTHVLILMKLEEIQYTLGELEKRISNLENR